MEDQKFDGGPAFPSKLNVLEKPIIGFEGEELEANSVANYPGMTLRDYFAAKALQGVLANPGGAVQANSACGWSLCNCTFDDVAEFSYRLADAMLKARNA